jgi:hypothetical protein
LNGGLITCFKGSNDGLFLQAIVQLATWVSSFRMDEGSDDGRVLLSKTRGCHPLCHQSQASPQHCHLSCHKGYASHGLYHLSSASCQSCLAGFFFSLPVGCCQGLQTNYINSIPSKSTIFDGGGASQDQSSNTAATAKVEEKCVSDITATDLTLFFIH